MNGFNFNAQLDRLREGKLILQEPGESGLTAYASTNLSELRQYVAALEAGYRAVSGRLEAYRGQAKGRTLGQVVKNQWSEGAALGYAAMAMTRYRTGHDHAAAILELMEEAMAEFDLEEAATYHQSFLEDRNRQTGERV